MVCLASSSALGKYDDYLELSFPACGGDSMHQLTDEDLREPSGPEGTPAIIRAASNPNAEVLKALLNRESPPQVPSHYQEISTSDRHTSALLAAIQSILPDNVALLLKHGADPNGLPTECFSRQSVRFLRFRNPVWTHTRATLPLREEALENSPYPQTCQVTTEELTLRRISRSRFWSHADSPMLQPGEQAVTALEAAAEAGDTEILNMLLQYGADASAWMQHTAVGGSLTLPSQLAISTPLHHAIDADRTSMISHLLEAGFSSNVFAAADITSALNPAMHAICKHKLLAFRILAPTTDFSFTTPIFNIHILHFAVATHSLKVINAVTDFVSLINHPLTALGHTLLHVACLPFSDDHINHHSEKCHVSVHEIRSLDQYVNIKTLHPHPRPNQLLRQPRTGGFHGLSQEQLKSGHGQQTAIMMRLLKEGVTQLGSQDVYGNTPLHYLAAHRAVNTGLLDALRHPQNGFGVEQIWRETKNLWGWTSKDLYDEGRATYESISRYMPFWRDPMGYWRGETWTDQLQKAE